jgi:hypothetical protein
MLLWASVAQAAGTVTTTEITRTSVRKVTFAWTSSAGGAADGATTAAFDGRIIGFATIPDSGTAPTALYDITLVDADGHDVLMGQGANRSATATEYVTEANMAGVASSKLTLHVTNAGTTKLGVVVVWIR